MAKRASRRKSSRNSKNSKEPLIVAFVLLCFTLIMADVGNNLLQEISYAKEMKAQVVAH